MTAQEDAAKNPSANLEPVAVHASIWPKLLLVSRMLLLFLGLSSWNLAMENLSNILDNEIVIVAAIKGCLMQLQAVFQLHLEAMLLSSE